MARMAISVDTVRKRDSPPKHPELELPGKRRFNTEVSGSTQTLLITPSFLKIILIY